MINFVARIGTLPRDRVREVDRTVKRDLGLIQPQPSDDEPPVAKTKRGEVWGAILESEENPEEVIKLAPDNVAPGRFVPVIPIGEAYAGFCER